MRYLAIALTVLGLLLSALSLRLYFSLYPAALELPPHVAPGWILAGICLIFAGHMFRAANWTLMFHPSDGITWRASFAGVCVGGLYNSVLPFRAGELIRAYAIGRYCSVSAAYALTAVAFERAVDGLILGTLGLGIALAVGVKSALWLGLYSALLAVSFLFLSAIALLRNLPLPLRLGTKRFTALFHEDLKNRLRFSLWSLSHGLHSRLSLPRVGLIVALAMLMWGVYLLGAAFLIYGAGAGIGPSSAALVAPSVFAASAVPSGPAYAGTYQLAFTALAADLVGHGRGLPFLAFAAWFAATVPLALAGICTVLLSRASVARRPFENAGKTEDDDRHAARMNKLSRRADVSREFARLLEAYFSGGTVWDLVNRAECGGAFKSLRVLKGGSSAVSLLVFRDEQVQVAKLAGSAHAAKLRSQKSWLLDRNGAPEIPRVTGEEERDGYYSLYLEHADHFQPMFQFIHGTDTDTAWTVLENVLRFVRRELHAKRAPIALSAARSAEDYVREKVLTKLNDAERLSPHIRELLRFDTLIVNGRPCRSIGAAAAAVLEAGPARYSLLRFRPCELHGDLTIENILVNPATLEFRLLDPNDENTLSAPALDFGKLYQSLHSGYEFLCELETVSISGNEIRFDELRSDAYTRLYTRLANALRELLSPDELRSIVFHEAVHFARLLTYRAVTRPETAPVFLGVCARLFEDFLALDFSRSGKDESDELRNLRLGSR